MPSRGPHVTHHGLEASLLKVGEEMVFRRLCRDLSRSRDLVAEPPMPHSGRGGMLSAGRGEAASGFVKGQAHSD